MANDDRVVADQNLLYQQADDPLTFENVECFGRGAQATEERRQCLCQAQIGGAILLLRSDRLQFGMHGPFPFPQPDIAAAVEQIDKSRRDLLAPLTELVASSIP